MNNGLQDIISTDDSQFPSQLTLTIIPDAHDSNNEECQNNLLLEDSILEDNHPTQLQHPAIIEEHVMSSTIGRRHSNRSSRPPLWKKYFVIATKSKS